MNDEQKKAPRLEWIDFDPGASCRWHVHDYPCDLAHWNHHPECEIHRIRSTHGVAFVGDHIQEYEPGYFAMVGPNLPHNWVPNLRPGETAIADHVVLQFRHERFLDAADLLPEVDMLGDLFERSRHGMVFLGETSERAGDILESIGAVSGLARLGRVFELLQVLAASTDYKLLSSPDFGPDLEPEVQVAVRQVMDYVYTSLTEDVRMSVAADLLGMTESSFSRFFKRNTGSNFVDYVRKLRVAKACELLADPNLSITDICFDAGFRNISNFNRRFRAEKGMPPSLYRKLLTQVTRSKPEDRKSLSLVSGS